MCIKDELLPCGGRLGLGGHISQNGNKAPFSSTSFDTASQMLCTVGSHDHGVSHNLQNPIFLGVHPQNWLSGGGFFFFLLRYRLEAPSDFFFNSYQKTPPPSSLLPPPFSPSYSFWVFIFFRFMIRNNATLYGTVAATQNAACLIPPEARREV